jgi:hypothetical protein
MQKRKGRLVTTSENTASCMFLYIDVRMVLVIINQIQGRESALAALAVSAPVRARPSLLRIQGDSRYLNLETDFLRRRSGMLFPH